MDQKDVQNISGNFFLKNEEQNMRSERTKYIVEKVEKLSCRKSTIYSR